MYTTMLLPGAAIDDNGYSRDTIQGITQTISRLSGELGTKSPKLMVKPKDSGYAKHRTLESMPFIEMRDHVFAALGPNIRLKLLAPIVVSLKEGVVNDSKIYRFWKSGLIDESTTRLIKRTYPNIGEHLSKIIDAKNFEVLYVVPIILDYKVMHDFGSQIERSMIHALHKGGSEDSAYYSVESVDDAITVLNVLQDHDSVLLNVLSSAWPSGTAKLIASSRKMVAPMMTVADIKPVDEVSFSWARASVNGILCEYILSIIDSKDLTFLVTYMSSLCSGMIAGVANFGSIGKFLALSEETIAMAKNLDSLTSYYAVSCLAVHESVS